MEEELPDIPYTPMRETSYDEAGPSNSSKGKVNESRSMILINPLQVLLSQRDHVP